MPDELNGDSTTGLTEDDDDDNDLIDDQTELDCGTDPKVVNALPDQDGDGICDAMDDILDLPFEFSYDSQHLDCLSIKLWKHSCQISLALERLKVSNLRVCCQMGLLLV